MINDLVQSSINKVRSVASRFTQGISNSINDNQGFVRQGQFTPLKQLTNNWSPNNLVTQGLLKAQQTIVPQGGKSENFFKSAGQGAIDFHTLGLTKSPIQGDQSTNIGKLGYGVGAGLSLFSPTNLATRGLGLVGRGVQSATTRGLISTAPKLAGSTIAKIAPVVTSELAQAGTYASASAIGSKLGLNDRETNAKTIATDFGLGLAFRGVGNITSNLFGVKGNMHPEDVTWLDTSVDTLRNKKASLKQKENAKTILYRLGENYLDKSQLPESGSASLISRRLQTLAGNQVGSGQIPTMGIVDKTKGVDTTSILPKKGSPSLRIRTRNSGEVLTDQLKTTKQQIGQLESNITSPTNPSPILPLPEGKTIQQVVRTKTQLRKVLSKDQNANVRIELKPGKGKIATLGQVPDREDVVSTLPTRLNSFIEDVLGYSTKAPKGGKKQANLYTKKLRGVQEKITSTVEEGMGSENAIIRNAAIGLQNFFRGLGMSPERAKASMDLRGEMSVANQRAYDIMDNLYQSLKNNKKSLERINAVLDPEISKVKVSFDQLSKTEKQVYGLIREGLDLIHDTSYANGHISPELYVKNKGKYVPRLYDVTELPQEVSKFVTQGRKIANDLYKQRKDIDTWKQDNSLNDPVYALGKRLAQVETNSAIKKYTEFLASNPRFISDIERPGFTKLSDSPSYGSLAGKYVLNSAVEDLKGFFFSNQAMQNLYDVFRAYDRLSIRQLQKKILTVFNPTTNVGNIVSDQVFGFLTGIDPLTLNKNLLKLKNNPKQFKQLNDYLMRSGITGTDITRTDFVNKLSSIDELALGKKPGKLKTITNKAQSFYGGTDDAYKVSALKSLLDKGFSLEESTRKVADGFQNYANVGKFYDLAAKTPIIGKPFIKFQGDLIRIIKNGAINNPLGLISFLATLKGVSYLSSKLSGESDEDRQTRENRFAAPMIPGLNIPLTWQTPIGEINVARYISPFYANNEVTNVAGNMLPFIPDINPNKDVASNIAMNVDDPLVSPLIQLGVNRDFRGKPISDPNENKYQPSTLTPGEKLLNQAKFTGRAYLPPPVNSAIDVNSAIQGEPNMYGTPQTIGQSVARLGGIKISNYNSQEVQKLRDKEADYQQYKNESIDKQISSVYKQQLKGEITEQQAENRINNLQSKKQDVAISGEKDNIYRYIDDNDTMRKIDIGKVESMPESTNYEKVAKEQEAFKLVDDIMENLDGENKAKALSSIGITPEQADYYNIARGNDTLKTAYVQEQMQNLVSQGGTRQDFLQMLVSGRKGINNKQVVSNGVLDNLYEDGFITYAERKELKNMQTDNRLKVSSNGGRKASFKQVKLKSIPKAKKATSRKIKLSGVKLAQNQPIKYNPIRYNPIKLKTSKAKK